MICFAKPYQSEATTAQAARLLNKCKLINDANTRHVCFELVLLEQEVAAEILDKGLRSEQASQMRVQRGGGNNSGDEVSYQGPGYQDQYSNEMSLPMQPMRGK